MATPLITTYMRRSERSASSAPPPSAIINSGSTEEATEDDDTEFEEPAEMTPSALPASTLTATPPSRVPKKGGTKRSLAWRLFDPFIVNGERKAKCKVEACRTLVNLDASNTSSMLRHARGLHSHEYLLAKSGRTFEEIKEAMKSSNIREILMGLEAQEPWDEERWRFKVLKWVVSTNTPLSAVDDPDWRDMISTANRAIIHFSRSTLTDLLQTTYEDYKVKIRGLIHEAKGKFSFTTDLWTSPANEAFMAITAHWIDNNWNLLHITLDFSAMEGSHTGPNICKKFVEVLDAWGLTNKVLGVTTDNASNNVSFCKHLERAASGFKATDHHFRCVAHVLNLAVQAAIDHPDVKATLAKLRRIVDYVVGSSQREEQLEEACRDIRYIRPQPDVKTRWNSTLNMVETMLRLKGPINYVIAQAGIAPSTSENGPPSPVDTQEWDMLAKLAEYLKPFKVISELEEGEKYPTLHRVVPLYNKLMDKLDVIIESKSS